MEFTNYHQKDLSNTAFLISGGAGFIGSNIVSYLLHFGAKKVRVIDNLSTGSLKNIEEFLKHPHFEFFQADISDYESCLKACEGIDYLSHQAALGSVPRSIENPIASNRSNVDGFLNMITAAREKKVKRLVYASSSSVYGDHLSLPKIESEIGQPLSPYAVSKRSNELYAGVAHLNHGQELIGLRYFNVFGPNQSPEGAYAAVIPLFIEALLNGVSPFINGDGSQSRDFTYVDNAVQANIRGFFTAKQEAIGQVFNVALGEQFTLLELFNIIQRKLNSKTPVIHREERPGDIKNSLADISKAKKLLNYRPLVKFEEGIERTIEWFKSKEN